jgi:hypothetical protein
MAAFETAYGVIQKVISHTATAPKFGRVAM